MLNVYVIHLQIFVAPKAVMLGPNGIWDLVSKKHFYQRVFGHKT
jgi:hypothetical protein